MKTTTTNGAGAVTTTKNLCLDLFSVAGVDQPANLITPFKKAFKENTDLSIRIMLHLRDIREGSGKRESFRALFKELISLDEKLAIRVLNRLPELGRWDDVLVALHTPIERHALRLIAKALNSDNALCAKWMPRPNGSNFDKRVIANKIAAYMKLSPKQYRKLLSKHTTVETQLCANDYDDIIFEHVPSIAAKKYQKTFKRHCTERYSDYLGLLSSGTGEVKINAGAIYPHEVVKGYYSGDQRAANAQWKALPNFVAEDAGNILPVIDNSASMSWYDVPGATNITPRDVAYALGLYLAEHNTSVFKDVVCTFSTNPSIKTLPAGDLGERLKFINRMVVGGSTDLIKVFELILTSATAHKLAEEDLPRKIVIFSDMQFNGNPSKTAFQEIAAKYKKHGYQLPNVIFWNLNASFNNKPVEFHQDSAALVSGYSPSLLKTVLGNVIDPLTVMLDTLMIDRYNY